VISIDRQCALLGISRSAYYYQAAEIDPIDLALMKQIDEQYTRTPFYGVLRMTAWLRRCGHRVNPKRVRRLMRLMGLEALYPKPNLSFASAAHPKFPYLLKGLTIDRPNQVWSADITYIRLQSGFIYLVAILDWFSRYVLSWEISTTLDKAFCLSALQRALAVSSPEIFNTDQGVQFTSADFVGALQTAGIRVSMDGRGRAFDNIFVERLWRTVKYEEVYLHSYQTVCEARLHLEKYFTSTTHRGCIRHWTIGLPVRFISKKVWGVLRYGSIEDRRLWGKCEGHFKNLDAENPHFHKNRRRNPKERDKTKTKAGSLDAP